MSLSTFLRELFSGGAPQVSRSPTFDKEDLLWSDDVLQEMEQVVRRDCAGHPPALDPAAGRWGAVVLYRASQLLVFRNLEATTFDAIFKERSPNSAMPGSHYSVDLALRYLPDVAMFGKRISEKDPLLERLQKIAEQWPLSSVGMPSVNVGNVEPIVKDAVLLAMYVDRIIARKDVARLGDSRVRDAVRAAIGPFHHLAPSGFAAALSETQQELTTANGQ